MADPSIYRWTLEGRLYLFCFPNLPRSGIQGWHFSADAAACSSIANLIDRMIATEWKSHKSISVSVPSRMLVNRPYEWRPAKAFLLRYPKGEVADNFWQISSIGSDICELSVGAAKLLDVKEALLGLPKWKDDFSLGPDAGNLRKKSHDERRTQQSLWFWTKVE